MRILGCRVVVLAFLAMTGCRTTAVGDGARAVAPSAAPAALSPGGPANRPGRTPNPRDVEIVWNQGRIWINGTALAASPTVNEVLAVIGPADRVSSLANRVHTFDKLGVHIYEPFGGRIVCITIDLRKFDADIGPAATYQGKLTIQGASIDSTSGLGDARRLSGAKVSRDGDVRIGSDGRTVLIPKPRSGEVLGEVDLNFPEPSSRADGALPGEAECRAGDTQGCLFAARASGPQDPRRVFFAEKACAGNNAFGCFLLAMAYQNGDGVQQSAERAQELHKKACALGDKPECSRVRNDERFR
ncbi:MAG TPA: hypothetical protein VHG72_05685 [Polyangia bacterium]|nr:hypothetical protein [Polyangia bacterium]